MTSRGRVLVGVLLSLALAGCGGGSHELSKDGSTTLSATVADLRVAAGARDVNRARADLAAIRTTVAGLQRQGDISDKRAAAVLASAAVVDSSLALITTTTTTAAPVVMDRGKHGEHPDKKKHEKGHHGD